MSKILITGAAGFIGSNLAKKLVRGRHQVVGLDSFEPNYPRANKEFNLQPLKKNRNFTLCEANLLDLALPEFLRREKFQYIYHQAATAGVRTSWGEDFNTAYVRNNITATQRLLEACLDENHRPLTSLEKFIYASSSSVYGDARGRGDLHEELPCLPLSPYGITKLAAEHLCSAYFVNLGVPTVSLRYFSVYGPGHRPDMAANIFIRLLFRGEPISAHKGNHARDFTYVGDVVAANLLARFAPAGSIFNVGGGAVVTLEEMIRTLERLTGRQAEINWIDNPPGNVHLTRADLTRARTILGYSPKVGIEQGLASEVAYIKKLYGY